MPLGELSMIVQEMKALNGQGKIWAPAQPFLGADWACRDGQAAIVAALKSLRSSSMRSGFLRFGAPPCVPHCPWSLSGPRRRHQERRAIGEWTRDRGFLLVVDLTDRAGHGSCPFGGRGMR